MHEYTKRFPNMPEKTFFRGYEMPNPFTISCSSMERALSLFMRSLDEKFLVTGYSVRASGLGYLEVTDTGAVLDPLLYPKADY